MEYQSFHDIPWEHGSFWVFVALVIFVFLVGKKIVAAINGLLNGRILAVRASIDEAAKLKAEAEAMLVAARKQQEQAEIDARNLMAMAKTEAERLSSELAEEAHATARRREALAMQRIAAAETAAMNDVREAAINLAKTVTSSFLKSSYTSDEDQRTIDTAIAALPAALQRRI